MRKEIPAWEFPLPFLPTVPPVVPQIYSCWRWQSFLRRMARAGWGKGDCLPPNWPTILHKWKCLLFSCSLLWMQLFCLLLCGWRKKRPFFLPLSNQWHKLMLIAPCILYSVWDLGLSEVQGKPSALQGQTPQRASSSHVRFDSFCETLPFGWNLPKVSSIWLLTPKWRPERSLHLVQEVAKSSFPNTDLRLFIWKF